VIGDERSDILIRSIIYNRSFSPTKYDPYVFYEIRTLEFRILGISS
jgi:hypothetical protein